jgi:hypothetical protein
MIFEDQFSDFALSKKLQELQVKQESLFYWTLDSLRGWEIRRNGEIFENSPWSPYLEDGDCSAFTVAELGEFLGEHVNGIQYSFCHGSIDWHWYNEKDDDFLYASTEADIRANKLIYLLNNKLISL